MGYDEKQAFQNPFRLNLILSLSRFLRILHWDIILLIGCKSNNSVMTFTEGNINVSMESYQIYEYQIVGGDEEDAVIKIHPACLAGCKKKCY